MVSAVHGITEVVPDPDSELKLAEQMKRDYDTAGLLEIYRRHSISDAPEEASKRRACVRAMIRSMGHGVTIKPNVTFVHPETMDIGDKVFIGDHAMLQGRYDGSFKIGRCSWLGPHSYFDARALVLGEYVGWGPGAKVLGSKHTGFPLDVPIIQTDLEILPVLVDDWSDIGVNAVLMPGITIGARSIVGAGAVTTKDVPPNAKVAGVPARVIGWRTDPTDMGNL